MRVIAGDYKGRQLKAVPGEATRPTSDKIKEAMFHKMGPFFQGGHCLDLFAGSGSLAIEALSRGIKTAILVDKSPHAIRTIHKNLQLLKIENDCEVYRTDAFRAIQAVQKKDLQFDLILLDPPYGKIDYTKLLLEIVKANILKENANIYFEHGTSEIIDFPKENLVVLSETKYNQTTTVTIFKRI